MNFWPVKTVGYDEGRRLPRYYGKCWACPERCAYVVAWVPLNVPLGALWRLWWLLKRGFKTPDEEWLRLTIEGQRKTIDRLLDQVADLRSQPFFDQRSAKPLTMERMNEAMRVFGMENKPDVQRRGADEPTGGGGDGGDDDLGAKEDGGGVPGA